MNAEAVARIDTDQPFTVIEAMPYVNGIDRAQGRYYASRPNRYRGGPARFIRKLTVVVIGAAASVTFSGGVANADAYCPGGSHAIPGTWVDADGDGEQDYGEYQCQADTPVVVNPPTGTQPPDETFPPDTNPPNTSTQPTHPPGTAKPPSATTQPPKPFNWEEYFNAKCPTPGAGHSEWVELLGIEEGSKLDAVLRNCLDSEVLGIIDDPRTGINCTPELRAAIAEQIWNAHLPTTTAAATTTEEITIPEATSSIPVVLIPPATVVSSTIAESSSSAVPSTEDPTTIAATSSTNGSTTSTNTTSTLGATTEAGTTTTEKIGRGSGSGGSSRGFGERLAGGAVAAAVLAGLILAVRTIRRGGGRRPSHA